MEKYGKFPHIDLQIHTIPAGFPASFLSLRKEPTICGTSGNLGCPKQFRKRATKPEDLHSLTAKFTVKLWESRRNGASVGTDLWSMDQNGDSRGKIFTSLVSGFYTKELSQFKGEKYVFHNWCPTSPPAQCNSRQSKTWTEGLKADTWGRRQNKIFVTLSQAKSFFVWHQTHYSRKIWNSGLHQNENYLPFRIHHYKNKNISHGLE